MPLIKRTKKILNKRIGNFSLATASWSYGDFIRIFEKPNKEYDFAVLLADTTGHSKQTRKKIEKKLFKDFTKPPWYYGKNASEVLLNLSKNIEKNRKNRKIGDIDKLESSCLSYSLFNNEFINHANAALPSAIRISKKGIEYIEKKSPPIGYLKYCKDILTHLKVNKDTFILATDGIFENSSYLKIVPIDPRNIKGDEDVRAYDILNRREFKTKLENLLIKNYYKNPNQLLNEIINNLGKYFIPIKEPHDDATIVIIKKVA